MFSLDNFYYILYTNLLEPVKFNCHYFYPFGSTDGNQLCADFIDYYLKSDRYLYRRNVIFYDQEPLIKESITKLNPVSSYAYFQSTKVFKILATVEAF